MVYTDRNPTTVTLRGALIDDNPKVLLSSDFMSGKRVRVLSCVLSAWRDSGGFTECFLTFGTTDVAVAGPPPSNDAYGVTTVKDLFVLGDEVIVEGRTTSSPGSNKGRYALTYQVL